MRSRASGFTLMEMMITIAIIGVLVAVAIPMWTSTTSKAKAESEVAPMFNDLRNRMDAYLRERLMYPPGTGEGALWPTPPTAGAKPLAPLPLEWQAIRFKHTGSGSVRCSYGWVTTGEPVGPIATSFAFVQPASPGRGWYYIVAHCNMDGDPAVDGFFMTTSDDPTIQKRDPGR